MRGCDWEWLRGKYISVVTYNELEVGGRGYEHIVWHGGVVAQPLQSEYVCLNETV